MKNTRSPLADSWNCPGTTRSRSPRCSYRSRKVWDCCCDQGQTNRASTAMTSQIGQANRTSGSRKLPSPLPLANQIAISLSRYMRDKVATTATNRLSVRIVGACPSAV